MEGLWVPPNVRSPRKALPLLWAQALSLRYQILGSTASIIRPGDPGAGQVNATTFRDLYLAGTNHVWTPSEALSAFDTPFDLTNPDNWQGAAPALTFNGTDEEADTPDDDYFTRIGAVATWGAWIRPSSVASNAILSKATLTTASPQAEWLFWINASSKLEMIFYDNSSASTNWRLLRPSSSSIVANQWQFVVATKATGEAATDINLYINGVADNGSGTKEASYIAAENTTALPRLGFYVGTAGTGTGFYAGRMAGGAFGPFYAQKALTAAEVKVLYTSERWLLGV